MGAGESSSADAVERGYPEEPTLELSIEGQGFISCLISLTDS